MIDIFITTKDRVELFKRSLSSLLENTNKGLFRLHVIYDGGIRPDIFDRVYDIADNVLFNNNNMGLGPSINLALAHIDTLNKWYESSPDPADEAKISQFVCYCQDDLLYSEGWLEKLTQYFCMFEQSKRIGFASGVECIEHGIKDELGEFQGQRVVTKDWIRAAQMFARREYWMSMFPIPAFDPETGRKRARPNDGMGSGVDWWFVRNHENSVTKSGRTCLTVPGLVKHLGYADSTWLDREMPESDDDKRDIRADNINELSELGQELQG